MASTIDFSRLNDDEVLFGYQRVNRSRFPDNFIACTEEIAKRGLPAPEKFEINCLGADIGLSLLQKIGEGFSTLAQIVTKRSPSPQA